LRTVVDYLRQRTYDRPVMFAGIPVDDRLVVELASRLRDADS
jgi:hypothetical protein